MPEPPPSPIRLRATPIVIPSAAEESKTVITQPTPVPPPPRPSFRRKPESIGSPLAEPPHPSFRRKPHPTPVIPSYPSGRGLG